jgi:type II secretion system protein N
VKVDWNTLRPRLLYGAFFVAAFVFALRQTLPAEAAKERLILEAAQRGWQVDAGEAGPAGLLGLALKDVTLKDKGGLSVSLDRLDATLPLWSLLTGKPKVALSARLYDGRVRGTFGLGTGLQTVEVELDGLDLAQAIPLRKASGVDLTGVVSGRGQVTVPADEKGRAEGHAELSVTGLGASGGSVPVGAMGNLTLPKLSLGTLAATLKIEAGKAVFDKLGTSGGDVDLNADGLYFMLQNPRLERLEFAPVFGKLGLKVSEPFLAKPENKSFKAMLDLAVGAAKGKDGVQFQVFGSLGHPQVRPI